MEPPDHLTPIDAPFGALLWRLPPGMTALSSAIVGGGSTGPSWILNIGVERDYRRTDLDAHVREVAEAAGLDGCGIGLLTAADVGRYGVGRERGLRVEATAGVTHPTWAAAPEESIGGGFSTGTTGATATAGTINVVARLPVTLEPGAAVNAVATITEAKSQAFFERGIPGTGTATDTVTVVWPSLEEPPTGKPPTGKPPTGEPPIRFCGPRAPWGAALARATSAAVGEAIDRIGTDGR